LFAKAGISGLTSFVTDAATQIPAMLRGENYDWKRGLTSFAIGFSIPFIAAGISALA